MDKWYYRDHLVNKENLDSKICQEVSLDLQVYKQSDLLFRKFKSSLTSNKLNISLISNFKVLIYIVCLKFMNVNQFKKQ